LSSQQLVFDLQAPQVIKEDLIFELLAHHLLRCMSGFMQPAPKMVPSRSPGRHIPRCVEAEVNRAKITLEVSYGPGADQ